MESALKEGPTGHKNMVSQDRWSFGDRFNYTELCDLLPGIGPQDRRSLIAVGSPDRFHF